MIFLPSEKIIKAKTLIDNGEFEETLEYLNDLEQKEALTLDERLNIQGIKSYLFFWLGKFELALQTAKNLYQTSQEFSKAIFSFDALFVKQLVFGTVASAVKYRKNYELIVSLFKSIPQEDLLTYLQLEADMDGIHAYTDYFLGKLDQSLKYADKCIAYYERNDPLSLILPFMVGAKGYDYFTKGELNLAIEYCEKALSLISKLNYRKPLFLKAEVYQLMGAIYYLKGDFDRALEYQINSLELYKKFEEGYMSAATYYGIIQILLIKKENDEVQRYFDRI